MKHSTFSPSQFPAVLCCNGFRPAQRKEYDEITIRGTNIHTLASAIIKNGDGELYNTKWSEELKMSREDMNTASWFATWCKNKALEKGCQVESEVILDTISMPIDKKSYWPLEVPDDWADDIKVDIKGTADAVIGKKGRLGNADIFSCLYVIDFKSFSRKDDSYDRLPQLAAYACDLTWHFLPEEEIYLVILHGATKEVEMIEVSVWWCRHILYTALSKRFIETIKLCTGKYCQYCAGQETCMAQQEVVDMALCDKESPLSIVGANYESLVKDPARAARNYKIADSVEHIVKNAKTVSKQVAQLNGGVIQDEEFGIAYGYRRRKGKKVCKDISKLLGELSNVSEDYEMLSLFDPPSYNAVVDFLVGQKDMKRKDAEELIEGCYRETEGTEYFTKIPVQKQIETKEVIVE